MPDPLTSASLSEIEARAAAATPGPWVVWDGPLYEGGGADLCIGRGKTWLANMDHRNPRCAQITEQGHKADDCDICTIDAGGVTDEQRANANLIAHARSDVPALVAAVREMVGLLRGLEWARGGARSENGFCPECDMDVRDGHGDSCPLAALLARFPEGG